MRRTSDWGKARVGSVLKAKTPFPAGRARMTDTTDIAAADWAARLSGEPSEADWLGFETWLQAAPGNRSAYDRALALSLELDRQAGPLAQALFALPPARRTRVASPLLLSAGLTALAAAVTVVILNPIMATKPLVYSTAAGERRQIVLADGTRVFLNTGTTLSVRLDRGSRELELAGGEAAFQVTHDATRPFVVHVGDRVVRDVGTDFDIAYGAGAIRVTVREGMVSFARSKDDLRSVSLGPGSRLEHREGVLGSTVTVADTDEAFAWRSGRLIYRDRPLSEVVADLNRYGKDQIEAVGPAAGLRFNGVLAINNQSAMVARLCALLPVSASREDGVIKLREINSLR